MFPSMRHAYTQTYLHTPCGLKICRYHRYGLRMRLALRSLLEQPHFFSMAHGIMADSYWADANLSPAQPVHHRYYLA
jgi:hypothetical protein